MSMFTDLRELPILIAFIKRKVDSWLVGIWNVKGFHGCYSCIYFVCTFNGEHQIYTIYELDWLIQGCILKIMMYSCNNLPNDKPKNSNFWMPYVSYAKNGAYVDISRCRWLHIYTNPTYIDIPRSDAKPSNPRYWPAAICIAVSIACSTTFVDRCQIRV